MKICFFCKIQERKKLFLVEFYNQDICILKKIDPNLTIATKYSEIDWSADLIFVWWWTYASYPVFLSKILRKKVLITGTFNYKCPMASRDYFRRPIWQRLLIKYSIKYSNINILVSKNEYDQIVKDWSLNNLVYSPHGVNTKKYTCGEYKNRTNTLFTISWISKENAKRKCLYEIIDSMEILRHRNLHLNIAGHEGDAIEDILSYIKNKGLDDCITFLGTITEEEKIRYLQECKFYLQPSRYEGFGLAIAEAMSCGAIVVTTDVGEVKTVVGNCGIILDDVSPMSIANTVIDYINKDLYEMSISASSRINELYSMKRREREIVEIVKRF